MNGGWLRLSTGRPARPGPGWLQHGKARGPAAAVRPRRQQPLAAASASPAGLLPASLAVRSVGCSRVFLSQPASPRRSEGGREGGGPLVRVHAPARHVLWSIRRAVGDGRAWHFPRGGAQAGPEAAAWCCCCCRSRKAMPPAWDGALSCLQMATGWEAEQPPATDGGGGSVESMRRIFFINNPERRMSEEEAGQGGREERSDGPARGALGSIPPWPRSSGEARRTVSISSPPSKKAPHREHRRDAQRLVSHYIVPCMNAYGLCIVDHFLGHRMGEKIWEEVLALYLHDKFQDGALASQKSGGSQAIRGDKILWVEGTEPGCESMGHLLKRMDKLIMYADGKLGQYKIRGRHKVSSHSTKDSLAAKCTLWLALSAFLISSPPNALLQISTQLFACGFNVLGTRACWS